jgi:hypothetical protein
MCRRDSAARLPRHRPCAEGSVTEEQAVRVLKVRETLSLTKALLQSLKTTDLGLEFAIPAWPTLTI